MASLPFRIGSGIRQGADAYLDMQKRAIEQERERAKNALAPVAEAGRDFAAGIQKEPEPAPQKDYVGEYLARNPGQAQELMKAVKPMDPTKAYQPEAPAPQVNITAPAVAAEMLRQKAAEERRRTIRRMPDGSYTNQGEGGEVVVKGGESVGPDIGAPGRGGLSMDTSDEARIRYENNLYGGSPEDRRKLEEDRAATRYAEIIQRNPFAREMFQAQMQERQQQSAIDRTYGQERAKQTAKVEAVGQLDAMEQAMAEEIETEPAYSTNPEAKARALEKLRVWRERQEVALGLRDRPEIGI